jgi:hypothetical protein
VTRVTGDRATVPRSNHVRRTQPAESERIIQIRTAVKQGKFANLAQSLCRSRKTNWPGFPIQKVFERQQQKMLERSLPRLMTSLLFAPSLPVHGPVPVGILIRPVVILWSLPRLRISPAVLSLRASANGLTKLKRPGSNAITDIQVIFRQSRPICEVGRLAGRAEPGRPLTSVPCSWIGAILPARSRWPGCHGLRRRSHDIHFVQGDRQGTRKELPGLHVDPHGGRPVKSSPTTRSLPLRPFLELNFGG